MGLLGDIYSAIDTKKRQVKGLLDDFGGTVDMGVRRFREDQQGLQNLFANAYPMAGDKTVLNSPQQIAQFQREAADKAGEMGLAGATVWHGSPHKFDKFDSSKIGTGEGAQAYGHGLYLAESPDVAKGYKDKLTDPAFKYAAMNDAKARLNEKIAKRIESIDPQKAAALRAEVASLGEPGGALYKVDLPDEHIAKMLDWDKPLSEQAPEVQSAMRKYGINPTPPSANRDAIEAAKAKFEQTKSRADYQELSRLMNEGRNVMGEGLIKGDMMRGVTDSNGVVLRPEEALRRAGVPGIKYLDGGSRGTGGGTSNYVIFPQNEGLLSILERNGQPVKRPFVYPQGKALETAQRNAAKPIKEGGLGLPANNTPMDRARAMGFDTDVYHGTGRDFNSFAKPKYGNVSNSTDSDMAHFTSTNPTISNEYAVAGMKSENNQVLANMHDSFSGPNRDEILKIIDGMGVKNAAQVNQMAERLVDHGPRNQIEARLMELANIGQGKASVMPLMASKSKFSTTDFGGADWTERGVSDALKQAKAGGFDGAAMMNIRDGLENADLGSTFAATNPAAFRSRFAAFDPARRNESDILGGMTPEMLKLLAGGTAGGLLGYNALKD